MLDSGAAGPWTFSQHRVPCVPCWNIRRVYGASTLSLPFRLVSAPDWSDLGPFGQFSRLTQYRSCILLHGLRSHRSVGQQGDGAPPSRSSDSGVLWSAAPILPCPSWVYQWLPVITRSQSYPEPYQTSQGSLGPGFLALPFHLPAICAKRLLFEVDDQLWLRAGKGPSISEATAGY